MTVTYPTLRTLPGHLYELLEPWAYRWRLSDKRVRVLRIGAGFRFDAGSVPRILWSLIDPRDLEVGALPHDLLYRRAGLTLPPEVYTIDGEPAHRPWTRREADRLFGRLLREPVALTGRPDPLPPTPRWKRRWAFRAVRAAGWWPWRRALRRNRGGDWA